MADSADRGPGTGNGGTEARGHPAIHWLGQGKWLYEYCCPTFPYVVTWFVGREPRTALAAFGDAMKRAVEIALEQCSEEPGRVVIHCSRCGQSYFS